MYVIVISILLSVEVNDRSHIISVVLVILVGIQLFIIYLKTWNN